MRHLAVLLLLAVFTMAAPQSEKQHGKTDAQILKMGLEGWMNYYSDTIGGSTADMAHSAEIYGKAAKRRNDRLLDEQLDGDFRMQVLTLRKALTEYSTASVDLDYAFAGGGTIHIPMWAAVVGDVEDVLYLILTSTGKKAPATVVSQVTKELDRNSRRIDEIRAEDKTYFKYNEAKKALAAMRANYRRVVDVAKKMSRKDSDRLLHYCLGRATK